MIETIRVRIAVAIDSGGEWNANGWGGLDKPYAPDAMGMARQCVGDDAAHYWIEAELPIPKSGTHADPESVVGEVQGHED